MKFTSISILATLSMALPIVAGAQTLCIGGITDSWVKIGACNQNVYCAEICVDKTKFGEGKNVGRVAEFLSSISDPPVPAPYLIDKSEEWMRPGSEEFSSGLTVFVLFCGSELEGSTQGNPCPKGKSYSGR
ncbi:hypothetical protein [uncultured Tateyamaria sp.]|uniref:hypothetical protein n=1 Tax=uncultured Tateyamaria sp. TaxID=455651 RepID=UPI00262FECEB|nr:hypothetical protein [uncultured Tateyamaria sp.]